MKVLVVLLAALLIGCAAQVVSSSARSVVVRAGSARAGEAQTLADSECRKYDRQHARLAGKTRENEWVFDCVN